VDKASEVFGTIQVEMEERGIHLNLHSGARQVAKRGGAVRPEDTPDDVASKQEGVPAATPGGRDDRVPGTSQERVNNSLVPTWPVYRTDEHLKRHVNESSQADLKAPGSACLWLRVLSQNAGQPLRAEVDILATNDHDLQSNSMQALDLKGKVAVPCHRNEGLGSPEPSARSCCEHHGHWCSRTFDHARQGVAFVMTASVEPRS